MFHILWRSKILLDSNECSMETHLAMKQNFQQVDLVSQDNCFSVGQDLSVVVGILGRDELEDCESLRMRVARD
jgi:hypothetical protein